MIAVNYDAAGNETSDVTSSYVWNAESQTKTAAGVTYTYDGDGDRVQKSNGKTYWYGMQSDALMETGLSGSLTDQYVFFGGKRIARSDASGNVVYYMADHLGTSRIVTNATGGILDQSDFYPFGGERVLTASSGNTYKFTAKERDAETNNDDFGARYYSSQFGRWTSPDWSAIPAPVPYANLTNPQTLNLYAMVSDNPETFADLNGHEECGPACHGAAASGGGGFAGDFSPLEGEDANMNAAGATPKQIYAVQAVEAQATAAQNQNAGAAPAAVPVLEKTMAEIDKVVEPLIESASKEVAPIIEEAAPVVGGLSKVLGVVVGAVAGLATSPALNSNESTMLDKTKGLPPDAVKLKKGQGYKDKDGNTWKKDTLHKDHWDVSDRKGRKIREVTFDGRQLWPGGPKNNQ